MYVDGKPQIPPFLNAVFHAGVMSGGQVTNSAIYKNIPM